MSTRKILYGIMIAILTVVFLYLVMQTENSCAQWCGV